MKRYADLNVQYHVTVPSLKHVKENTTLNLELNVNQKIRYVKFDSHGFPIYDGIESVAYFDGSLGEEDKLFEKEQQ